MEWYVASVDAFLQQLQSFVPIVMRQGKVDVFTQVLTELQSAISASKVPRKQTLASAFEIGGIVNQISTLLLFCEKIIQRATRGTSALVSSVEISHTIIALGRYSTLVREFLASPELEAFLETLTIAPCGTLDDAFALFHKHNAIRMWASILSRCPNSEAFIEQTKTESIAGIEQPPLLMSNNWFEQMPQLMVRRATPFQKIDISVLSRMHKFNIHLIRISNFSKTDIEYLLPTPRGNATQGVSTEYINATMLTRVIPSGGISGGITRTCTGITPVIVETNGELSRMIEAPSTILRGSPSMRIHAFNEIFEAKVLRNILPHITHTIRIDPSDMLNKITNSIMVNRLQNINRDLVNIVPGITDPEMRLTVISTLASVVGSLKQARVDMKNTLLSKTGIVEHIYRKAIVLENGGH